HLQVTPGAGIAEIAVRRTRQVGHSLPDAELAHYAIDFLFLIDDIGAQPHAFAAIIQPQGGLAVLLRLVIDGGIATPVHAVEAHAKRIVFAEPATSVDMGAEHRIREVVRRYPGQRFDLGALRHDVDGATDVAAGRHAAEQRARSLQHLDPLGHVDRHPEIGHQSVHAIESDVLAGDRETPQSEILVDIGARAGGAHRRLVSQYVDDAARLLILDGLHGVAGDAERRIQDV